MLDPSDSSISFIQPLFVVSITVLRCLFRSLLCHACLNLHYILTSAERRDFSNPIAFLELLFDKSNQSQSSFLDCWPMVSGCWVEKKCTKHFIGFLFLNWGQLIQISYCQIYLEKLPVCNFKSRTSRLSTFTQATYCT